MEQANLIDIGLPAALASHSAGTQTGIYLIQKIRQQGRVSRLSDSEVYEGAPIHVLDMGSWHIKGLRGGPAATP